MGHMNIQEHRKLGEALKGTDIAGIILFGKFLKWRRVEK